MLDEQNQEEVVDQNEEITEEQKTEEVTQETDESGEIEVKIGDSPSADDDQDQEGDSDVIRRLRAANRERAQREREAAKKARELEEELSKFKTQTSEVQAPGVRPKLSDFDYDEDKHEAALSQWYEKQKRYEEHQASEIKKKQDIQDKFNQKLNEYRAGAESVKSRAKDYDQAEDEVKTILSVEQQNFLLMYGDKPELTVYGLGKNRTELERLAKIKDPLQFAKELGRIEASRSVVNKPKPQVQVEKTVTSGTSKTISSKLLDEALERAQQTGNMDEYRRLRKAQAK